MFLGILDIPDIMEYFYNPFPNTEKCKKPRTTTKNTKVKI